MFNIAIKKSFRLYEEVKDSNKDAAHDILKNLFCRFPGDVKCFTKYFDHCVENAVEASDNEAKRDWLQEASMSLNVFIERTSYSARVIEIIDSCRNTIEEVAGSVVSGDPSDEVTSEDSEEVEISRVLELFARTKETDKELAFIVLKNLFSSHLANRECFSYYFDFCLSVVDESGVSSETRDAYYDKADVALQMFAEKTACDEESLLLIKEKRSILNELYEKAESRRREELLRKEALIHKKVKQDLDTLASRIDYISGIKSRTELDRVVDEISSVESALDKGVFNEAEQNEYAKLSKKLSDVLPKKLETFKKEENYKYNSEAIQNIKQSFDLFTGDEKKYKKIDADFRSDIAAKMLSLDSSKMSSETYAYYNYVYGYMFSKMDNENKYNLTLLSLENSR